MIAHLSYVMCDECGDPAEAIGEGAKAAREIARAQGYVRTDDGRDLCWRCVAAIEQAPLPDPGDKS